MTLRKPLSHASYKPLNTSSKFYFKDLKISDKLKSNQIAMHQPLKQCTTFQSGASSPRTSPVHSLYANQIEKLSNASPFHATEAFGNDGINGVIVAI
ncbi:hypothetical protein V6N12_011704 [Hibiscus sabdariffa]|uniref:Uncharacterized protein n=1 Tax=Hibiscus sabdariffa TaxID=183260 RepID=A0ABR2BT63_9ROSI